MREIIWKYFSCFHSFDASCCCHLERERKSQEVGCLTSQEAFSSLKPHLQAPRCRVIPQPMSVPAPEINSVHDIISASELSELTWGKWCSGCSLNEAPWGEHTPQLCDLEHILKLTGRVGTLVLISLRAYKD